MKSLACLCLLFATCAAWASAPPRVDVAFTHVTVIDGTDAAPKPDQTVVVSDSRSAVRELKEKGAQFIKVYERVPREAYFAIADEAGKLGIPFAGHVPEAITAAEASDAGQRSIEHLSHLLEHCRSREPTGGQPIY